MPSIRVVAFGGMKPKDNRNFGQASRAEVARDVKLWHGTLEPWRYPSKFLETGEEKLCSIYKQDCCYIASPNPCADFARGDTDCNIVYSTGHMPWPAYALLPDNCDPCEYPELEWKRLGVPNPERAPDIIDFDPPKAPVPLPVVTGGDYDCQDPDYCGDAAQAEPWQSNAGEQKSREPRSYIYTFVDPLGNESAPSEASEVIDTDINGNATIGFVTTPPEDGFEIAFIRIYRGVPLYGNPEDPRVNVPGQMQFQEAVGSEYFFVSEIPYTEGMVTFTDDVPADCLGEIAPKCCFGPPPECLENLIVTENGTLVGSVGKKVYFSEPWRFHAWACDLNLDHCVKAMEFSRGQIYVATDSYPYVINPEFGDEDCYCCRQVTKATIKAPITCKKSMVSTATGVMYASNHGLIKMDGAALNVNTSSYLSQDNWLKYRPHELTAAYHMGMYFGFNSQGGFIWDVSEGAYSDEYIGEAARFTELSLTPDAVFTTDQDELVMSFDGDIYKWDDSDTFMPFFWRTKLNVEAGYRNYSVAKIVGKDWLRTRSFPNEVTVRFYIDDKLMFTRKVNCSKPFRLPRGFEGINFQIELEGIEEIMELHMATSHGELTNTNNS